MNKLLLSTLLLALTCVSLNAKMEHNRDDQSSQSIAERATWKESLMEEIESEDAEISKGPQAAVMGAREIITSHSGIIYYAVAVTPSGNEVTLMDGSVWQIKSWDTPHTRNWLASDPIVIMPNNTFFTFYDYKLLNRTTGAEVEANLLLTPILGTNYTFQITGFNDNYNYIYMNDGSVWSISPYDHSLYFDWMIGDIIIIGANVGWDSNIRPNVLINATHKTYIRANCIQ